MKIDLKITEDIWYFKRIGITTNSIVALYHPMNSKLTVVGKYKKYLPKVIELLSESLVPIENKFQVVLEWYKKGKIKN